jgi:hypothetical protein
MRIPEWAPWAAVGGAVALYLFQQSVKKGDAPGPLGGGYVKPLGFAPSGCAGRPGGCPPEGPPAGYEYWTGNSAEVVAYARGLLGQDLGTWHQVTLGGRAYMMHIECHFHPCGGLVQPNGWHKGVTVYVEKSV